MSMGCCFQLKKLLPACQLGYLNMWHSLKDRELERERETETE